jgi:hypothetical protein
VSSSSLCNGIGRVLVANATQYANNLYHSKNITQKKPEPTKKEETKANCSSYGANSLNQHVTLFSAELKMVCSALVLRSLRIFIEFRAPQQLIFHICGNSWFSSK